MEMTTASLTPLKRASLQYVQIYLGEESSLVWKQALIQDVVTYLRRSGVSEVSICSDRLLEGLPQLVDLMAPFAQRILVQLKVHAPLPQDLAAVLLQLAQRQIELALLLPGGLTADLHTAWVNAACQAGFGSILPLCLVKQDVEETQSVTPQNLSRLRQYHRKSAIQPLESGAAGWLPLHALISEDGLSCQKGLVVSQAGVLYDCEYNLTHHHPMILGGREGMGIQDLRGADLRGQPIRCGNQCGHCATDTKVLPQPGAVSQIHALA